MLMPEEAICNAPLAPCSGALEGRQPPGEDQRAVHALVNTPSAWMYPLMVSAA